MSEDRKDTFETSLEQRIMKCTMNSLSLCKQNYLQFNLKMKILNWNRYKTNYRLNYTFSDFIHCCFINITFKLPMLSLTTKDERKVNVNNHSLSQKN